MHYHSEKLSTKAEWVEGHVHGHRASGKGRLARSGVCPLLRAPFLAVHLWPVGKLRWAHLSLSDTEGELLIASECCSLRSSLFCCSVVSDSLWPHGLQHSRLPCPSPSPRVCSDSCPLSWWCHPTSSSSLSLSTFKETRGPDNAPGHPPHLQEETRPHASGEFPWRMGVLSPGWSVVHWLKAPGATLEGARMLCCKQMGSESHGSFFWVSWQFLKEQLFW